MTDGNPPPTDESSTQEANAHTSASESFDFSALFNAAKDYLVKPMTLVEAMKGMATNAADYFSSKKDGGLNASLGFYLVVLAALVIFRALAGAFSLNIFGFFLALPSTLVFGILYLAIGSALIHVIAMTLGQSKESFWQGVVIVSQLSWVVLLWEFPLWVFLPGLLKALITVAGLLLWAYMAIPATATKYKISTGKHVIAVWAVSGVMCFFVLMGAFTKKAVDTAGDYYVQKAEELQRQAMEQADQIRAQVEQQQLQAQQQRADQASVAAEAATVAAKAAGTSPAKQVKEILMELKALGAAEAPSNLKGALRKLNGHLQKADFSGIQAKGLDLRSIDLSGAKFDNAVIDGWWFHGFQNNPGSNLDGASFEGATFTNANMKKTSLVGADFSGAKLVSTKDFEVAISLDEANVSEADFSDITFTGPARGKALRLSKADARGADFTGSQLPNTDMQGADIRGADFSNSVLRGVVFKKTDMREAKFRKADLTEMEISPNVKLDMQIIWGSSDTNRNEGVDFSGAKLNGVDLKYAHLRFCNFEEATFINTDMEGAILIGSDFKKADLTGANLKHANLAAANFSGANLRNTNWQYAHTAATNLKGHDISKLVTKPDLYNSVSIPSSKGGKNPDNLESIVTGSNKNYAGENFSGKSFQGVRITQIDFSGANFDNANFDYAEIGDTIFSLCSMKGATFRFARLNDCNFDEANLANADFYGAAFDENSFKKAILTKADFRYTGRGNFGINGNLYFSEADLSGANFHMTRLSWSDRQDSTRAEVRIKPMAGIHFDRANLTNVDFTEAWLEGLKLDGANLTGVDATNANFAGSHSTFDTIWGGADFRNANMSFGGIDRADVVNNTDGKTDFHTLKLKGSNWRGFKWFGGVLLGPVDFSGCFFAQAPWEDPAKAEKGYAGTDFFSVAMPNAKFVGADLRYCGFGNTLLTGADFSNADCSYTSWSIGNSVTVAYEENLGPYDKRYNNIDFSNTKFHGVDFAGGDFKGSDFSSAKFNSESRLNPHVTSNGPTGLKE